MTQNSVFAIRLLEKIGAPLVAAIESAPPEGENSEVQAAEMMAKMLGQAVLISIKLSGTLNAQETEEQADSTRLSLAAIATPLLAEFYVKNKRVPEDKDILRISKSLEAVIGFADKFTPAADGQSRLTTIDGDIAFYDGTQAILTTMQALTPAVMAISDFSFGQSDIKLMQEVASRLEEKATILAGGAENKLGQILVLKSLAMIYAQCHYQEVSKSVGDQSVAPSLDPVWEAFEKRTMMMQALSGMDLTPSGVNAGGGVAPVAVAPPPVQQQAPAPVQEAPPPVQAPPVENIQTPAQEQAAPPPTAPPAGAGGPMGFFKPGAKDGASTPAAAPAQEAPPAAAAQAPAQQQAQPKDETASSFEDNSAPPPPPSNPMGFFKPGAKKEENE